MAESNTSGSSSNYTGIQGQIHRISGAVQRAYAAVGNMGGSVPSSKTVENLSSAVNSIPKGSDTSDATATAGDILSGKTAYAKGAKVTGTIASKTASDLAASGATVTVPAGYYPSQAAKSVATATQATPSISVDSAGKITASASQTAGYVSAGTKSATKQLTTQSGMTITPGVYQKTAVPAGLYTTGDVTVDGDYNLRSCNIVRGVSIFGVYGDAPNINGAQTCSLRSTSTMYTSVTFSVATSQSGLIDALNSGRTFILHLYFSGSSTSINSRIMSVFGIGDGLNFTGKIVHVSDNYFTDESDFNFTIAAVSPSKTASGSLKITYEGALSSIFVGVYYADIQIL